MNISEATALQRVLSWLDDDGDDHSDETTRRKLAEDLEFLDRRAYQAMGAGNHRSRFTWDEQLCRVAIDPKPTNLTREQYDALEDELVGDEQRAQRRSA